MILVDPGFKQGAFTYNLYTPPGPTNNNSNSNNKQYSIISLGLRHNKLCIVSTYVKFAGCHTCCF